MRQISGSDRNGRDVRDEVEKVVLVGVNLSGRGGWFEEESLKELELLADTAGARVVASVIQIRQTPDPAYYIGRGKAHEIKELAERVEADLVVFDDDLSPAQARNLERMIQKRVIDRSELILDIFAQRARTAQAKAQVELAQLQYLLPRLKRMWKHLSRIRGGIGLRGPGETQLEVDRRVIKRKITDLKKRIARIEKVRHLQRQRRLEEFNVAIVGYTNAGKSTLFNRLTKGDAFVEDRLFATLDATTRVVTVGRRKLLLTDTVGFIKKLPHHLVASFRATLEEVVEADLLLHIIDSSHPELEERLKTVDEVLGDLGVLAKPRIRVFNKIDLISDKSQLVMLRETYPEGVFCSALNDELDELTDALEARLTRREIIAEFLLPLEDHRGIAEICRVGEIVSRISENGLHRLRVKLKVEDRDRLLSRGFRGVGESAKQDE
ncbi:MAG: GTPase HflX [Candidatus Glassbacteria bacterium]